MGGVYIGDQLQKQLGEFLSGMKNAVEQARLEIGYSKDEGKKATSFDVYKKICEPVFK